MVQLCEALPLQPKSIIAAVGAGGKTTALERLAAELAAQEACVVCTTTTAVWEPAGLVVVEADEQALLAAVARLARPGRTITAAGGRQSVAGRPKLIGVAPGLPALLLALPGVDYVLVEADGARGRAIKAPADHEPVIPPAAALVLALVGIDALGEPLDDQTAHRPERLAGLLGIATGTPLTPRHIASVLVHPQGGRKGVPPGARFVPLINKVQDEPALRGARAIAGHLRGQAGIDRVVIAALLSAQPVLEVW